MSWAFFLVPIATDNYAVASVRPGVGTALSGVRLQDTVIINTRGPPELLTANLRELEEKKVGSII